MLENLIKKLHHLRFNDYVSVKRAIGNSHSAERGFLKKVNGLHYILIPLRNKKWYNYWINTYIWQFKINPAANVKFSDILLDSLIYNYMPSFFFLFLHVIGESLVLVSTQTTEGLAFWEITRVTYDMTIHFILLKCRSLCLTGKSGLSCLGIKTRILTN